MKKNRIVLTKEILALSSTIRIREMGVANGNLGTVIAGIDSTSIYGGSDLLEDVSMAIGCYDDRIKDTDENPNGIRFDETLEDKMYDLHNFVMENIETIENLIHYWSNKGGLSPGTYNTVTLQKVE